MTPAQPFNTFPEEQPCLAPPLHPRRRASKLAEIEAIEAIMKIGKDLMLLGDSIIRNMVRFSNNYLELFPSSTVLNAGIASDTVETLLYKVQYFATHTLHILQFFVALIICPFAHPPLFLQQ